MPPVGGLCHHVMGDGGRLLCMCGLERISTPTVPGLFVTGTDTGVGKTVAACLIADQLRRRSLDASPRSRIGVFKPIATGCRREREGLVSGDAEQLAWAADFDPDIGDLSVICPAPMREPLAPAVALERAGARLDVEAIERSLQRLSERCSHVVIEGLGGVMAPIQREAASSGRRERMLTMLDLMTAIGCPVVVVCPAGLGSLNHTAMTCWLIRQARLPLAGLIVNGYEADTTDVAIQTNRTWLTLQNQTPILATLPAWENTSAGASANPWDARAINPELREAIDVTDFAALMAPGRPPSR